MRKIANLMGKFIANLSAFDWIVGHHRLLFGD
jgi:hypothetical protein